MKSRTFFLAAATCAVVLTGCDWGGTSESDSWNDAYNWVNFTGSYSVGNITSDTSTTTSSDTTTTTTVTTTATVVSNTVSRTDSFTLGSGPSISMSGTLSKHPVVPGSLSITVSHSAVGEFAYADDGSGSLSGSGGGSVNYETGAWSVKLPSSTPAGAKATAKYLYTTVTTVPGASDSSSSSSSSSKSSSSSTKAALSTIHVIQKGNLFTFTDNNGRVYNGKITGASIPSTGYSVACTVNISYEVTANNGYKMVGNFSGNWSGASSSANGTLSGRTITGTYKYGSSHADFTGTAPSITTSTPSTSTASE